MVFYDHAAAVMREISCARAAVTESQELTGALTIGTIESICASIFPDLMEAFHKAHPKVKVSMVLDSPDVLLDRMNHNAIDFVYLLDQKIYDHRWVKVLEEPEDIVFGVASSAHPLAGRKALELKELLPEPFLLTEKDGQLPVCSGPVSDVHGSADRAVFRNWKRGIYHPPAEKRCRDLLSSGVFH